MSRNNILTLMDQFFDDTFRPVGGTIVRSLGSTPALNVKEFDDTYEVSLTIPGIDPNKVKIELQQKVLNVSYEHSNESQEKDSEGDLLRQEYSHYSFSRSVALPKNVDEDGVEAKSSKGILTITIKKIPEAKPKTVSIQVIE
ncbi:MAG: Hsp20/alpha crystallin family protein [bacterium]